jgi:hypothetical protein
MITQATAHVCHQEYRGAQHHIQTLLPHQPAAPRVGLALTLNVAEHDEECKLFFGAGHPAATRLFLRRTLVQLECTGLGAVVKVERNKRS